MNVHEGWGMEHRHESLGYEIDGFLHADTERDERDR